MEQLPTDWNQLAGSVMALFFALLFFIGCFLEYTETPEEKAKAKPRKPLLNIPDIKLPVYMVEEEILMPSQPQQQLCNQKVAQYTEILQAIGFSSRDAQSKVNSLLKQNPNLTQEELLRKATQ
jgi:hypothetical protein